MSHKFVIQADVKDVAIAVVILWEDRMAALILCTYVSKKFNTTERIWSVWDKEVAAIKLTFSTWRHSLKEAQTPSEIWTDYKNLEALCTPVQLGVE